MISNRFTIKWHIVLIVTCVTGILFYTGLSRLKIDTDIVSSLPKKDPVISSAKYVIMNNPMQDRIVIDLSNNQNNMDMLVKGAVFIEGRLSGSGLFKNTGSDEMQKLFPEMISFVINNLNLLFTADDLERKVAPLTEEKKIREIFRDNLAKLYDLNGIGQGSFFERDPLGLKNIILERLAGLAPSGEVSIYRGHLLSKDGNHLLIIAEARDRSMDTANSRKISGLIDKIGTELNKKFSSQNCVFTLTPAGAYRAALDNETIASNDTENAFTYVTIGIILLLLFSFPRPFFSVLSLLPAIFGTTMALFVYSLFYDSISIIALGFGGALISLTVDHGIAYLLFLDRPYETHGKDAAAEVMSIGFISMMINIGAFLALSLSGYSILSQIGLFSALGIILSYLFVHYIFPRIIPEMPPARKNKIPVLQRIAVRLSSGTRVAAVCALVFALVMLFFVKIKFQVDLASMNTVSSATLEAEELVRKTWGDIFNKVFIMTEGKNIGDIQAVSDRVSIMTDEAVADGMFESAFNSSTIFPGDLKARRNYSAWIKFWDKERKAELFRCVKKVSAETGFSPDAFRPFYNIINKKYNPVKIPGSFYNIFGISQEEKTKTLYQFSSLAPGKNYNAQKFYDKFSGMPEIKIFDPVFFSKRLGENLSYIFIMMVCLIGLSAASVLFIYFFDWKITLAAIMPVAFALICTLGTMNIIGHPLDIPSILLSIIIIGLGIDYSLFFVCSYQRYMNAAHPSLGLIPMAVFLSAASTMIGFGVLALSDHSLLRSAGLTSFLGIGYSFIGTLALLPPVLKKIFAPVVLPDEKIEAGSKRHFSRAIARYRHMETYPRLFARFKLKLDPMFPRLAEFLDSPSTIMDIGCGYGVPAVWLLELYPKAFVYGIDPDQERIRIAGKAIGSRGKMISGKAPDLPDIPVKADAVLLLDIIHMLNDKDLDITLQKIYNSTRTGARLIIRVTVPSEKNFPWERILEKIRLRVLNIKPYFRSVEDMSYMITGAGFRITETSQSAPGREETWIISEKIGRKKKT